MRKRKMKQIRKNDMGLTSVSEGKQIKQGLRGKRSKKGDGKKIKEGIDISPIDSSHQMTI